MEPGRSCPQLRAVAQAAEQKARSKEIDRIARSHGVNMPNPAKHASRIMRSLAQDGEHLSEPGSELTVWARDENREGELRSIGNLLARSRLRTRSQVSRRGKRQPEGEPLPRDHAGDGIKYRDNRLRSLLRELRKRYSAGKMSYCFAA